MGERETERERHLFSFLLFIGYSERVGVIWWRRLCLAGAQPEFDF